MDKRKLVTIKTFNNVLDADVAKQHLRSHGIEAIVSKDDCGGMRPWLQGQQGVDLQVFENESDKANIILKVMKS